MKTAKKKTACYARNFYYKKQWFVQKINNVNIPCCCLLSKDAKHLHASTLTCASTGSNMSSVSLSLIASIPGISF